MKIPRKAKTFNQICELSHDNVCQGDFSILLAEGEVYLTEQAAGESVKQSIKVPRKAFNAFIDWYNTGRVPRGDKAARGGGR